MEHLCIYAYLPERRKREVLKQPSARALVSEASALDLSRMKNPQVTGELRRLAQEISACVTRMHPLTGQLEDGTARAEVLKALFELTKQVEVIKKQVLKLEKGDDSASV